MEQILVCLTGVVNRSIKYTWHSINDNLVSELNKKFHVDIAIFNNNVEDCKVDGVSLNNNDMSVVPYKYLIEYKQSFITDEVQKIEFYEKYGSDRWQGNDKLNGFRQMYIDSKIIDLLEQHRNKYKYVLVTNADYFYVNKFSIENLKLLNNNSLLTCHQTDHGGITDGFYMAYPHIIEKIVNRINYYDKLIHQINRRYNYEIILNNSIMINNIQRIKIDLFFLKLRANCKWKHLHERKPIFENQIIPIFKKYLQENKDKYPEYNYLCNIRMEAT